MIHPIAITSYFSFCFLLLLVSATAASLQDLKQKCEQNNLVAANPDEFKFHFSALLNKCYMRTKTVRSWHDSKAYCENTILPLYYAGTMVKIEAKAEIELLVRTVKFDGRKYESDRWHFYTGARVPESVRRFKNGSAIPPKRQIFRWVSDETSVDEKLWRWGYPKKPTHLPTTTESPENVAYCTTTFLFDYSWTLTNIACNGKFQTVCQLLPKNEDTRSTSNPASISKSTTSDQLNNHKNTTQRTFESSMGLTASSSWWLLVAFGSCALAAIVAASVCAIRWKLRQRDRQKAARNRTKTQDQKIKKETETGETKQETETSDGASIFEQTWTNSDSSGKQTNTQTSSPASQGISISGGPMTSITEYSRPVPSKID